LARDGRVEVATLRRTRDASTASSPPRSVVLGGQR
jgi:hypothetical protein